jgi:hypothetical protein
MAKIKSEALMMAQNSRVKLPFEMIITKLCDSLEMPKMVSQKKLPVPHKFNPERARLDSKDLISNGE